MVGKVSVNGKRVYISGPMSDDPATYHAHQFIDAHMLVKASGAREVYDPAVCWLYYDGGERTHEDWMRECLSELTKRRIYDAMVDGTYYDVLVSLPGWEKSEGASTERTVAEACGIECVNLEDVE